MLYHFNLKKTAAESHRLLTEAHGELAPSDKMCRDWFRRFKDGNFDLEDKDRSGRPNKLEDIELQALLDENPAQTQKRLANVLDVDQTTISRRLHAMGKIQKEGKWVPLNC